MSHMGGKLSRSSEKDASNSVMPRVREYRKVGDLVSQRKAGKSNPTTAPLTGIKSPDPQVSCQHRTSVCNSPQTCHYIQSIWLSAHLTCFVRKKKIKVSSVWVVNFNEITTTPPPPTLRRQLWREWNGGIQRHGGKGGNLHRPLWQDLQQRGGAQLRQAAAEAARAPAQGPGGGLLLRGHDGPRHTDGHEAAASGGGVPAGRKVSDRTDGAPKRTIATLRSRTCVVHSFPIQSLFRSPGSPGTACLLSPAPCLSSHHHHHHPGCHPHRIHQLHGGLGKLRYF